ncbi:MAG: Mor transcription activator family protein [Lysobacterales bacterium]
MSGSAIFDELVAVLSAHFKRKRIANHDALSRSTVLELASVAGGRPLYIPQNIKRQSNADELAAILSGLFARQQIAGHDALAKSTVLELANLFGGRSVYIPKAMEVRRNLRNAEIASAIRNGESVKEVAARHEITTSATYRIAAAAGLKFLSGKRS